MTDDENDIIRRAEVVATLVDPRLRLNPVGYLLWLNASLLIESEMAVIDIELKKKTVSLKPRTKIVPLDELDTPEDAHRKMQLATKELQLILELAAQILTKKISDLSSS